MKSELETELAEMCQSLSESRVTSRALGKTNQTLIKACHNTPGEGGPMARI
jgi:hypothetical protein